MKKLLLFSALFLVQFLSLAQTKSLVVRMDTVVVSSYSMSAKGPLNILQTNNPLVKKITVTVMQGKRPVWTAQFASVEEFNRSNVTSSIRAVVSAGSRVMIQIDGLNIIKVLPVVE